MQNDIERLRKYLEKKMPEGSIVPDIRAALVFTNDQVDLQIGEDETPPAPTLQLNKLKEFIRKTAKTSPLSMAKVDQVQQTLKID
jgi:hypothetical protein